MEGDTVIRRIPKDTISYELSGEKIQFKIYNPKDPTGVLYYNMHDNENTAVEAMDSILKKYEGKFIELQFKGKRLVGGWLNQQRYFWVDPNRIYTDLGIYKTLRKFNSYNAYSRKAVKAFGQFITDSLLKDAKIIIAMHNNQNGYSLNHYKKGAVYASSAAKYHHNPRRSPHDFFYVVDSSLYEFVVQHGFNAVLQNAETVQDDGSLSVYCANQGIHYVNIEAKAGHLAEQIEMLELLQTYLWSDSLFQAKP